MTHLPRFPDWPGVAGPKFDLPEGINGINNENHVSSYYWVKLRKWRDVRSVTHKIGAHP